VFALQTLGIEVDPINTVQFSNNTGYPVFKGQVLSGDEVWTIFEGLLANNLANYTHLLTGYSRSPSSLGTIVKIRDKLKERNPNLIHVCDPVLGDEGVLYVSEELVDIYRDIVIPKADYLFPNQTEIEFLTRQKITNEKEALSAISRLHDMGIRHVVVTSLYYEGPDYIIVLGSTSASSDASAQVFKIRVPKLATVVKWPYFGTGDLFAALILGWSLHSPTNLASSCEKAVATLSKVLLRTHQERLIHPETAKELCLIQSLSDVINPVPELKAEFI